MSKNSNNSSLNLSIILTLNRMYYHRHSLRLRHTSPIEFANIFKEQYREISSALSGPETINQKLRTHIRKRDHLDK